MTAPILNSTTKVERVIVAGGRDFTDYDKCKQEVLEAINSGFISCDAELVCGEARGADTMGKLVWQHCLQNKIHSFIPNWDLYKKRAGILRNIEMGDFADKLIAFWDGESRGTKQMIDYMTKLGKPVTVIRYQGEQK